MQPELKVIKSFYDTKQKKLYFSQIKDHAKLSNSSLQIRLLQLAKKDFFTTEQTKANKYYVLNDKKQTALQFAQFDVERFNGLHRTVKMPLLEFVKKLPSNIFSVVLFGSSSRKQEEKTSDIDLLIVLHNFIDVQVQKKYEQEIVLACDVAKKNAQALSIHHFSITITTIDELKTTKDHLLVQARDTGFPIVNEQLYHEMMYDEY